MASYRLIIGLSIAIPAEHGDAAREVLSSVLAPVSIETALSGESNADEGEVELRLAFEVRNRPPTDDRLQDLREGALLAMTSSVVDALYRSHIPCRLLGWGCTDPQRS